MKIKITPLLFIVLSLLSLVLFLRLWVGAGSLPEIWELEAQITNQTQLNKKQLSMNDALQADLSELSKDDVAIEDHARSELGMIKKGETYYQVILRKGDSNPLAVITEKKPKNNAE